ncbi:hypothetical protein QUC31_007811 [Theobroma cacao]
MIGFCCGLIEFLSRESVLSRNALSDCVKGGGTDLGFRFLLINIALIMLLVIALLLNYCSVGVAYKMVYWSIEKPEPELPISLSLPGCQDESRYGDLPFCSDREFSCTIR